MFQNFDEISKQVPEEIRSKVDPKSSDEDIILEVSDEEEDQPESLEWP